MAIRSGNIATGLLLNVLLGPNVPFFCCILSDFKYKYQHLGRRLQDWTRTEKNTVDMVVISLHDDHLDQLLDFGYVIMGLVFSDSWSHCILHACHPITDML